MNASSDEQRARPVRPRDAASLVIHRQRRGHHEVLMGRRGHKARFKPGVYVFPGGVLERGDYQARPLSPLKPGLATLMAVGQSTRKANALAMAAVREAYEEAGLLFGAAGEIGNVRHRTWNDFRRLGRTPDLAALEFLGRAITPSFQSMRFHARFFGVHYDQLSGSIGGDGELEDLRWIRLDQADAWEMMIVQGMILETLRQRLAGRHAPPQRLFHGWGKTRIVDA